MYTPLQSSFAVPAEEGGDSALASWQERQSMEPSLSVAFSRWHYRRMYLWIEREATVAMDVSPKSVNSRLRGIGRQ